MIVNFINKMHKEKNVKMNTTMENLNLDKFLNFEKIMFYDFYIILFSFLFFIISFITLFFIFKPLYRSIYVVFSVLIIILFILLSSNILGKPLYIEYYHNIFLNKSSNYELLYVHIVNEKSKHGNEYEKRGFFLLKDEKNTEPLYFTMIIDEKTEKKLMEIMRDNERNRLRGRERNEETKIRINRKGFRSYEIEIINKQITPKKLPDKVISEMGGGFRTDNNANIGENGEQTFLPSDRYGSSNFP